MIESLLESRYTELKIQKITVLQHKL